MKDISLFLLTGLLLLLISSNSFAQHVGIGTNNPQAALDVFSTTSGFLPPRMSAAQRNAIQNPVAGLQVWCTDCGISGELSIYNGTNWRSTYTYNSNVGVNPPASPTNLTANFSLPISYLQWTDAATNETGYKIERKTGEGNFELIATISPNSNRFNDSSISLANVYTYRVYAFNESGNSPQYSNEISVSTLAIGQNYAGGIIFYLDATRQHGIVCAPTDQGQAVWGCNGVYFGTVQDLGSGALNTYFIISQCSDTTITAAKLCNNGYSDWYLPSRLELYYLRYNLVQNGFANLFTVNNYYWTSSEYNTNQAYVGALMQSNDYSNPASRNDTYAVRAVRSC